MKQTIKSIGIFTAIIICFGFGTQPKNYKLDLSAQEIQVIYDALGELPAKTSEQIRAKIAKQVTEQNQNTNK
jgi:VanZ family protein